MSRVAAGPRARLLLAALLLLLAAILLFQRQRFQEPPPPAARQEFKAFPGTVRIERDLQAVSLSGGGPTALDGMDRGQLTAFRRERIEKYRQLGLFPADYSPFVPPHDQIFGSITPGADWLYSVPYYVANPYLLIILVPANHVTPLDMRLDEVNVLYRDGVLAETIRGASARGWFEAAFSSDIAGTIRLVMVNAWDAGFRFIHLDPSLSRNVRPGKRPDSVTRSWHSQHGIFHVGHYGKNNLSPEDQRGWVEIGKRDEPTRLHVKLWRSQPAAVSDRADLAFVFDIDPDAP